MAGMATVIRDAAVPADDPGIALLVMSWIILVLLLVLFFAFAIRRWRDFLAQIFVLRRQPPAGWWAPLTAAAHNEIALKHAEYLYVPKFVWKDARTVICTCLLALVLTLLYFVLGLAQMGGASGRYAVSFLQVFLDSLWTLGMLLLPSALLLFRLPARWNLGMLNDMLAIIALWFPNEFGWMPPHVQGLLTSSGADFPVVKVLFLVQSAFLFTIVRPTGLNWDFSFEAFQFADTYQRAYAGCLVFLVFGLPLCLLTKFVTWGPSTDTLLGFAGTYVAIYFLIALVEEFLFRAVIQRLIEDYIETYFPDLSFASEAQLEQDPLETELSTMHQDHLAIEEEAPPLDADHHHTHYSTYQQHISSLLKPNESVWRQRRATLWEWLWIPKTTLVGLCVGAFIFGLAHLDNSTPGYPEPNFVYMFFATFAGLLYGWVYRKTGYLTASAITHATVDWLWSTIFH